MAKTRNVLAGPFIGEFGWELFCWQGFLRKRRPQYNSMTVICRTGHRALYEDFADNIIEMYIPTKSINMWRNDDFDPEPVVSYYKKPNDFTDFIPYNRFKSRWWKEPDGRSKQRFIPFGLRKYKTGFDILMHVRCAHHHKTSYRNWTTSSAYEFARWASRKYSVACIGIGDTSGVMPYTVECRDLRLELLTDIMTDSRVLIGSQSGVSHLAALCELPVIAWQENQDSADRLSKHWNPFNVKTWTKPALSGCKQEGKPFTPSLEWMKEKTLEALDAADGD